MLKVSSLSFHLAKGNGIARKGKKIFLSIKIMQLDIYIFSPKAKKSGEIKEINFILF